MKTLPIPKTPFTVSALGFGVAYLGTAISGEEAVRLVANYVNDIDNAAHPPDRILNRYPHIERIYHPVQDDHSIIIEISTTTERF